MSIPFSRAPHIEGAGAPAHPSQAPNAALLIDFDNVTMGMRSDLSKELKTLLNSDVIRGKVTVQRAYADWRRYPQYIVPLSEASIDLIFAPAYGSSKKNATDIRMAIDGMELVFTRPEIGTYILLTGDSDFSSLVLKLKEYGKYVIGVGIQESSSDILVQNCDEYYSYTSLSGLRKTDESGDTAQDPWVLVERAADQMAKRGDVMRSDRLKQVMLEFDPGFDEKSFGFSKFSRFLSEAAGKGLIRIQKMENGQYEVFPSKGAAPRTEAGRGGGRGRKPDERGRKPDERRAAPARDGARKEEPKEAPRGRAAAPSAAAPSAPPPSETAPSRAARAGVSGGAHAETGALAMAYRLLRNAISDLLEDQESDSVRDSDVKRRMLALDAGFDEGVFGFPKFSRFLRQAHDHEVVDLQKGDDGNYQVALGSREAPPAERERAGAPAESGPARSAEATPSPEGERARRPPPSRAPAAGRTEPAEAGQAGERPGAPRLRPREGVPGRHARPDEPPPIFEGQMVARRPSRRGEPEPTASAVPPRTAEGDGAVLPPATLHLPTGRDSMVQYLTNSYAGVGKKTAETLVDALGEELFVVLQRNPSQVEALLPAARAEKLLEAWSADFQRRRERYGPGAAGAGEAAATSSTETEGNGGQEGTVVEAEAEVSASAEPPARRSRRTRSGR